MAPWFSALAEAFIDVVSRICTDAKFPSAWSKRATAMLSRQPVVCGPKWKIWVGRVAVTTGNRKTYSTDESVLDPDEVNTPLALPPLGT